MTPHNTTDLTDPILIDLIKHGAVGVVPSDTVYGLMASAHNQAATARLYDLKQRDQNPGTIIAADSTQLEALGLKPRYIRAVEQYWPNPLSVIIPCDDKLAYLHLGKSSLAVRIPADALLRELLEQTGPLLTSSANYAGQPVARNIAEARAYFGDQVDFYVDAGDLGARPASTIIRIVDDAIEILRSGAVIIDENGRITNP